MSIEATGNKDNFFTATSGFKSWLFTLDHKRIGLMYLVFIIGSFALGGLFALLIRLELLTPGTLFMTDKQFNQAFTLHGVIMVFLFIVPSIPASIGNFVLPIQLGAKDVAFPKLNLFSFHLYLIGAAFALFAVVTNAVDTGWTFYTPYSTQTDTGVIMTVLGAFILGFSSILTGVNFLTTIHQMRPKGMTWFKMPLFVWSLYATAIIQVLATPVLGITLLLLIAERVMNIGIFDPSLGGDPVLFEHFFWFYSHPAVYIMILPAMGVMSELVTAFCKKRIFGYTAIAYSSIAIAIISFIVWGHHLFLSGQSNYANLVFSLLTFLVAIPSAIKVFNWLATMYKGSIDLKSPFSYFISFILLFAIGGFTGVVLGTLSTDVNLHDTYYVVAHFHYTMLGGTLMAFLGAIHYWWPKMVGKMYNEFAAQLACFLLFVGFNITFFTQFMLGSHGMPRRYHTYIQNPEFQIYHVISTIGSWILLLSFLIIAGYLLHSIFKGKKASNSPWGAITLEWQTTSPPPLENFNTDPKVTMGPYDFDKV